jgi:hypothetical protein
MGNGTQNLGRTLQASAEQALLFGKNSLGQPGLLTPNSGIAIFNAETKQIILHMS